MGNVIAYNENLTKAKALGYSDAACMACGNISTPQSKTCKKCIDSTPAFTKAVEEFISGVNKNPQ